MQTQFGETIPDWADWQAWRHNCYEAAFRYGLAHNLTIIHGTAWDCRARRDIAHAWCEDGDKVIDLTQRRSEWDKVEYYRQYEPENMKRYSLIEAVRNLSIINHFGPWIPGTEQEPLEEDDSD